jgi:hypothetical protein
MHQPADLETVRASYDRVAGTCAELGIGDLGPRRAEPGSPV